MCVCNTCTQAGGGAGGGASGGGGARERGRGKGEGRERGSRTHSALSMEAQLWAPSHKPEIPTRSETKSQMLNPLRTTQVAPKMPLKIIFEIFTVGHLKKLVSNI